MLENTLARIHVIQLALSALNAHTASMCLSTEDISQSPMYGAETDGGR